MYIQALNFYSSLQSLTFSLKARNPNPNPNPNSYFENWNFSSLDNFYTEQAFELFDVKNVEEFEVKFSEGGIYLTLDLP